MNMSEFFSMGGFAFYIWTSFAAALLLLAIEVIMIKRQRTILMRRLKHMEFLRREEVSEV